MEAATVTSVKGSQGELVTQQPVGGVASPVRVERLKLTHMPMTEEERASPATRERDLDARRRHEPRVHLLRRVVFVPQELLLITWLLVKKWTRWYEAAASAVSRHHGKWLVEELFSMVDIQRLRSGLGRGRVLASRNEFNCRTRQ
jgi:hypothetical protein